MRPAVTVVVIGGDDSTELISAVHGIDPEIPIVDLGVGAHSVQSSAADLFARAEIAGSEFLWFLTADCRPAQDCLDELLDAIAATESIAAVGPKLIHDHVLVSAGVTTTSAGARVNPLGSGELDQGQRDAHVETLGLDLPGMLVVTREAERVGLPARSLGTAYVGLEYSRRLRDLGHRVLLAPAAHIEIGRSRAERMDSSARPPRSAGQLRLEQRYRLSLGQPRGQFLRLLLSRLGQIITGLFANDFGQARWSAAGLVGLVADASRTSALRRANAARRRRQHMSGHLAGLFAEDAELAVQRRRADEGNAADGLPGGDDPAGRDPAGHQIGDTEEDLESFSRIEVGGGPALLRHPLTLLVLVGVLLSVGLSHRLFGPGHLSGGALGSTDVTWGELVSRLLATTLDSSTGVHAVADPYHLLLAGLSLPFFGHLDLMARCLLLLAPVLAAAIGYGCAGIMVSRPWVRAFAALLWTCAPVFTSAIATGRLGTVLVWITVPLFILALRRSLRFGSTAAAATAGLLGFVLLAGVPLLLLGLLAITFVLVFTGRGLRHLWLLAPSVVLGWPWLLGLIQAPDALLVLPGQSLAPAPPASYLLALGFDTPLDMSGIHALLSSWGLAEPNAATLALWAPALALPLLILAFLTLVETRLDPRLLGWSVGLYIGGLAIAFGAVLLPAQAGAFDLIGTSPVSGMILLCLGAIMLLGLGLEEAQVNGTQINGTQANGTQANGTQANPRMADRTGVGRVLVNRVLAVLCVLVVAVFAVIGLNTTSGADRVRTVEHGRVPALAADRAAGDGHGRTLSLDTVDGQVLAELVSTADGTVLGTSTLESAASVGGWPWLRRPLPLPADRVLIAQAAASLAADDAGDADDLLRRLGVDFVLVGTDAKSLQVSVSASAGLVEVGPTESGRLWRVDGKVSGRYLIRAADGTLSQAQVTGSTVEVPVGPDGRVLLVAERASTVNATLGGETLPRPRSDISEDSDTSHDTDTNRNSDTSGDTNQNSDTSEDGAWAAEFSLPAGGGTVELSRTPSWYPPLVIVGWVLGVLSIIVAIPFGGRRRHYGVRIADASSRIAEGQR